MSKTAASKAPALTERQVQEQIVDALRAAGLVVFTTSAPRQRGPSGVARGIPDLLVCADCIPRTYLGLEVKKPGPVKFSSAEQQKAHQECRFALVQSPEEALNAAHGWLADAIHPTQERHESCLAMAGRVARIWAGMTRGAA